MGVRAGSVCMLSHPVQWINATRRVGQYWTWIRLIPTLSTPRFFLFFFFFGVLTVSFDLTFVLNCPPRKIK